jgi:hypothetical protein
MGANLELCVCTPTSLLRSQLCCQLSYFARWLGSEETEIERLLVLMMVLYVHIYSALGDCNECRPQAELLWQCQGAMF